MSSDESSTDKECPLCMEPFDFDDINFYPCTCQYQICRFCWHRLRTDENGLCPACRQPYPENPVNYQPVSGTELQKIKSKSKMANKNGKVKSADGRKHLSNYRVLQKNLVYVVGLSQKLADAEVLKKIEFFGKFGKILKVVVGTTPILNNAGQQTSCSAYVTYEKDDDALRAIEAVNNAVLDGRLLKASLGTTKYCSTFLRGQTCHKSIGGKMDCMYLHRIAEPEASFTKEDMHAGKHTEFEIKLHEELKARTAVATQKRRAASGSTSKTDSKKQEENFSESSTNSSEQENSSSVMDSECLVAVTNIADVPIQHSSPINVLQTITNNTQMEDNQTYFTNFRPVPSSPSSSERSSSHKNKFTTCEEFERMLMMETKEPTKNSNKCNGTSHSPNINFDDDLGFDPFSESIKGLADLVMEEQESRKNKQSIPQTPPQNNLNFLFNRFQSPLPQPVQRPLIETNSTDSPRLYNSYLHQNTYMRYNQFRDYAKSALNAANTWTVPPPPGLASHNAIGPTNGIYSKK